MINLGFSYKRMAIALLNVVIFSLSASISGARVFPYVTPASWSPDGSKVTITINNDVTVRDAATNQVLYMLSGHTDSVSMVAWSPDSKMIATSSRDKSVKLWSGTDGSILHTLSGHSDFVTALTWSPDGQRVLSSGLEIEPSLFVWDSRTGELLSTHDEGTIVDMVFSPDGQKLVLTISLRIKVREALTLEYIAQSPRVACCSNQMYSTTWSPDGSMIVTGSINGLVTLWDASTAQMLMQFEANPHFQPDSREVDNIALSWVRDVTFAPDGSTIMSISGDGTIREWAVETGTLIQETQIMPLASATWSPFSGRLAVVDLTTQDSGTLNDRQEFDASILAGNLNIVVPFATPERLGALAEGCGASTSAARTLIQQARVSDSSIFEQTLTEAQIPLGCAADLIAVAEALQSQ